MAEELPNIQMIIHFLKTPDFFCIGAKIITPMIPLITGEPPTIATAVEFVPNQGYNIKAKIIEMALKTPKYSPNAVSKNMKFFYLNTDFIA